MSGIGQKRLNTYAKGAPANYIAGLGRGAIGFTTRSDIGPARAPGTAEGSAELGPAAGPALPSQLIPAGRGAGRGVPMAAGPPPGYIPGGGRGLGGELITPGAGRGSGTAGVGGFGRAKDDREDFGDYSETNYDEFSGYGGTKGLFHDTPYDKDDAEADRIYASIDDHMDQRRKRRRELRELEDLKLARQARPKIADQFADLKSQLGKVSDAEWEAIPDIGDHSLKYKQSQRKAERFTPVPDHVIDGARQQHATSGTAMDPLGTMTPGTSSVMGLAEARGTVLSLKLDKMSDSISGQTVVDPKGYLTDLNSIKITSDAEIGDIKKARLLLKSVTLTNPKHGPGWVAAARLEEVAGKLIQARKIIAQGCEHCPDQEDVWLEAARLHNPQDAKIVFAKAVRQLTTSVNIWLHAAQLEVHVEAKKLVLRRALEFIPHSVKLWKAVIELEDPEGARIMLGRAVECIPRSVELWLALARLEKYVEAKKTLNRARQAIPTEPSIWIAAAKLEEANGHIESLDRIIQAAMTSLRNRQVLMDRHQWIAEAQKCEQSKSFLTCESILKFALDLELEPEDRKRTWMDDAESATSLGFPHTAKSIYAHALVQFPTKKSIWLRAAALEKEIGTSESYERLLQRATGYCPEAEILWLMAAKEVWKFGKGGVDQARLILQQAFQSNPNSEAIWLAAVKLEWEQNEFARARALLAKARTQAPSARVWMKSILLERELEVCGNSEQALLTEGLAKYPECAKLYMMMCQFYQNNPGTDHDDDHHQELAIRSCRQWYKTGLRHCPTCIPLWIQSARYEERVANAMKARSVLELGRLKNPASPMLWLEATRLEARAGSPGQSQTLLAKALQECPTSGILLAESILIAPRAQQRAASLTALRKCDSDPYVCLAVARLFWNERKFAKSRKWLERTVQLEPDLGDAWAYYYAFELERGNEEQRATVFQRAVAAEPHHGEVWCAIVKETPNRRKPIDALLRLVTTELEKQRTMK